jgi:hypothetical protein
MSRIAIPAIAMASTTGATVDIDAQVKKTVTRRCCTRAGSGFRHRPAPVV